MGRWFPLVPQAVTLAVFALLVVGGLGVTTDDPAFAKVLRNTNLANLIVWSYWWPAIIATAVLFGRAWCTVCPIELVSYAAGRIGLRRRVPAWLRSGWAVTIFYALVLLVGVQSLSIHRLPHRMALYLLRLFAVALLVGFVFEKRAFCSYVCPVGHLLGLYAMVAPFEWRTDDPNVCKTCKTKDCVAKKNHYRFSGRSCTSDLYPAALDDNRRCLVCTQCFKACPSDNLRFSIRRPFADFFRSPQLRSAEMAFILIVSGFVVYEILSEWSVSNNALTWLPNQIVTGLNLTAPLSSLVTAAVMFLLFPAVLFLAVGMAARVLSGVSLRQSFASLALLLLPTMAAAHTLKALLKMTSRIPYWRYALNDPQGISTAQQIMDGLLKLDTSVTEVLQPALTFTAAGLLTAALAALLLILIKAPTMRHVSKRARTVYFAGAVSYWAVFALTIARWRF